MNVKRIIIVLLVLGLAAAGFVFLRPRGAPDVAPMNSFLATWSDPTDSRIRRFVIGADAARLIETVASLQRAGLDEATFDATKVSGEEEKITYAGFTTLRFKDGGSIRAAARATLVGGRVIAAPSVINTKLRGWERLVVEANGSPTRGAIKDRGGHLLSSGGAGERVPVRDDLSTAMRLIDRSVGPPVAGAPSRRLLAGSAQRVIARSPLVNGHEITTSLDEVMQRKAVAVMRGHSGALIALDPSTGGIRALVSTEDPTQPGLSPAADGHLPGSTFKLVTAAAALESERWTVNDPVRCPSNLVVGSVTISNFRGEASDSFNFAQAFAHSCNTAFATIGLRTGLGALLETANRLGFDGSGPAGSAPSRIDVPRGPDLVAKLSFGASNVVMNPVHLAGIGATIARDGVFVEPRWIEGADDAGVRALSKKTARQLRQLMERVVGEGTGQEVAIANTELAGKTGTAQRRLANGGTTNDAWFVVLAPANDTRLVVVIYLPGGGVGGQAAAPLAREFLTKTRSVWRQPD